MFTEEFTINVHTSDAQETKKNAQMHIEHAAKMGGEKVFEEVVYVDEFGDTATLAVCKDEDSVFFHYKYRYVTILRNAKYGRNTTLATAEFFLQKSQNKLDQLQRLLPHLIK